jgi:membrane-associated phospholipid phosphatase
MRRMARLRERYPAQIHWVKARFSPEGTLGLHLTIGALTLVAMAWIFGHIAEDVMTRDSIVLLDQKLTDWFQLHGTPALFWAMSVITGFASVAWIACATIVGAAFLIWHRAWYRLLILLLVVPGGGMLNMLLKAAFRRDRPVLEHPLVVLHSYSFPSGHTMGATLLYGLAAVLALYRARTWRARAGIVAAASCSIFLIGLSRVALGAHFLSDVLGAAAAGLAWLAVCVTSVETLRRQRLARSRGPEEPCAMDQG